MKNLVSAQCHRVSRYVSVIYEEFTYLWMAPILIVRWKLAKTQQCLYSGDKYQVDLLLHTWMTKFNYTNRSCQDFNNKGRMYPYTAERRDVLGNTSPEAREISRGRGFCTPRPERLPEGEARGHHAPPLDEKGGVIAEKISPLISENFLVLILAWSCTFGS